MAHFGVVAPAFYSHFKRAAGAGRWPCTRAATASPSCTARTPRLPQRCAHRLPRGRRRQPPTGFAGAVAAPRRQSGRPARLRRVILDMAGSTDMLCRELPAADRTAAASTPSSADQMEAAGGLVAEALGLPFVSVACALPVNRDPGVPLPVMPFDYEDSERALHIVEGSTRVYDWMMTPHRPRHRRPRAPLRPRRARRPARMPVAAGPDQPDGGRLRFSAQRAARPLPPRRPAARSPPHPGPARTPPDAGRRARAPLRVRLARHHAGPRFGLFERIAKACRRIDAQLLVAHCGGLDARQERALEKAGATWVCAFAPQRACSRAPTPSSRMPA
jgi:zeaxanthin glucosyltransferase